MLNRNTFKWHSQCSSNNQEVIIMAKRRKAAKSAKRGPVTNKGWAFIGSLPILGFVLVYLMKKNDKFAMFYAKQGLALGLGYIVINFVLTLLIVTIPLMFIWSLVCFILWIMSAANALSGKKKQTPLFGKFVR